MRTFYYGFYILLLLFSCSSFAKPDSNQRIVIDRPALYPETLIINPDSGAFVVGSFREGAVFEIRPHGEARPLIVDDRLISVMGIAIDSNKRRIYAVNADLGASVKSTAEGVKTTAALGIYDLDTGKPIKYIDLTAVSKQPAYLPNGLTLDPAGNAYVTDSFSPIIYKVTADGEASVFLQSEQFQGEGINLNGIVYHPGGFLLTVKKSDGTLFKIPLKKPEHFVAVATDRKYVGGDGLVLLDPNILLIVSNKASGVSANSLDAVHSKDGWHSSSAGFNHSLGEVYPTTGAVQGSSVYVVHSSLNRLIEAAPNKKHELQEKAIISRIDLPESALQ